MSEPPFWVRRAREQWHYYGQARPPFAAPVGQGQESVWDYPRPPRIDADQREVVVECGGVEVARTRRALRVLETASPPTFYLPPNDVRSEMLVACGGGSFCEWKGQARYWAVVVPDRPPAPSAAWSYEAPFAGFERLAGYLAFYPQMLECYVDAVRVAPQPGGFYGGWVTPELVGPFKGTPGSEGW